MFQGITGDLKGQPYDSVIQLQQPDGSIFHLLTGREYVVGRRDCDVLVPNDMSISRKHAVLTVVHSESSISSTDKVPTLFIKDMSKLGTLLRGERITVADTQRAINSGDVLEFGTAGISKYSCVYEPLIVTASCLDHAAKRCLKLQLYKLGGHVINDWTNGCCLVVMTTLSVTVKVICALVSQKFIVTPQYITDLVSAIESNTKLPDPSDYLPPLAESQVNPSDVSFKPNGLRRTLFDGKTFIFLSASQHKKLSAAIESAGGVTVVMEDSVAMETEQRLVAEGTCVMHCDAATEPVESKRHWIQRIQQLLAKSDRRMITESEIGFAVLYCSTSNYCNPTQNPEPSSKPSALPMQSFSVPLVSQQQVSQVVPAAQHVGSHTQTIQNVTPSVEIKLEPVSQQPAVSGFRAPVAPNKRSREEDGNEQRQLKQARVEPSTSATAASHTDSTVAMTTRDSHTADVEYSASVKVESTFVADSLPAEDCKYTDSELIVCDKSPHKSPIVSRQHRRETVAAKRTEPASSVTLARLQDVASRNSVVSSQRTSEPVVASPAAVTVENESESVVKNSISTPTCDKTSSSNNKISSQTVTDTMYDVNSVPAGFLSARLPITICRDMNYIKEENLPVGAVVTEDCSLVVRRGPQRTERLITNSQNFTTWNGQQVKNFKRFKKSSNASRRVISGRDLVVHEEITAQQQEWFNNGLKQQTETSVKNTDKLSQELFNWEPPKRRKY